MELIHTQVQRLNQQQLQSVELLQMSAAELEAYLRELSQENPVVELDDSQPAAEHFQEDALLRQLRWLELNDEQNRYYYQHASEDEADPLNRVGTGGGLEETLFRFLSRQLYSQKLDENAAQAVRYLAACLDEDGYLHISTEELAEAMSLPVRQVAGYVDILRSLEPAGVGAASLSQCLELQLLRIHETGPALDIVRFHLEALAKRRYSAIAAQLSIPVEQVRQAEALIRELDPKPGSAFEQPGQALYILPDVYVEQEEGELRVRLRGAERSSFRISGYYRRLLEQTDDRKLRTYLTEKVHQAEGVLRALDQRESTLLRCARAVVERQREFFHRGPQALVPLRMADVARDLDVHESTVSRTVREKYLQCSSGVYPLSYFFSRSAVAQAGAAQVGGTASRALLARLIEKEDRSAPLSDQKLCEAMAQLGCPISRRTVAKYRGELNIPNASGRRAAPSR